MSEERGPRCVFIGNIPYDATEEQLTDVLSEVGPVVSFRLVFDRDTGKPKGYGFCEYRDPETAQSAMRNLNGHEINGRALRVDFAESGMGNTSNSSNASSRRVTGRSNAPSTSNVNNNANSSNSSSVSNKRSYSTMSAPSAPSTNTSSQVGGNTIEQLNTIFERLGHNKIFEVIANVKVLIEKDPEKARALLAANPHLAFALLYSQVILGQMNAQALPQFIIPQPSMMMPPLQQQSMAMPPQMQMPPQQPMQSFQPVSQNYYMNTQPTQPVQYHPSQFINPAIGMIPAQQQQPMDQQQLIQQVLQLTPEQINTLPAMQQQQVRQLQAHVRSQMGLYA